MWNKVAHKVWALAAKKDYLQITWVHAYYLKLESVENCEGPKNATWVIRKIISTKQHVALGLQDDQVDFLCARIKFPYQKVVWCNAPIASKIPL